MKNFTKFLGIIALLAIIGLMASCETEADPEDQLIIYFTGLPTNANDKWAEMKIYEEKSDNKPVAVSSVPKKIVNNRAYAEMVYPEDDEKLGGKAYGKDGSYIVHIEIFENESGGTSYYTGDTSSKVSLNKGSTSFDIEKLYPAITSGYFPTPPVDDPNDPNNPNPNAPSASFGIYICNYGSPNITETIVLSETQFNISDNSKPANQIQDHLYFTITSWADAPVPNVKPNDYSSTYTKGYKLTGKITDGSPVNTSIYGNLTAPGFGQSDINTTECHMYIYTTGTGNTFQFIRTAFSKNSGTDDTTAVNFSSTSTTARVYSRE